MQRFETATLWRVSLAAQTAPDQFAEARENLRSAYMRFRDRASLLAGEIARDLPDYTVHDITHIDSLWNLADLIAGQNIILTPPEAFVLGGAFLVHDLGNGLAAYPDGIGALRSSPLWDDTVAHILRREFGRAPNMAELRNPNEIVRREALADVLRRLHAEHAERLALVSWSDTDSNERFHLIEDSFLRQHFGKLIGRIAHSHWWPVHRLSIEFDSVLGPPAGFPREWTIDPLILACLLRVADAAHLDSSRAPVWLKVIRQPRGSSRTHWSFQEKLNQPITEGDRLVFTSAPFGANEADAWWMCFDALQLLDRELSNVDAMLADLHRKQVAIRGVKSAGQADRLSRLIQTDGWLPVDTKVRVGDVAGLARMLGGEQLYGEDRLVPLRELIQNASDAVRARSFLQSWPPERGEVIVRNGTDEFGHFIEVADNGVGMSPVVMTNYLLDFGRSFWSGPNVSEELPGLLPSGFMPTGKYGIGFFSVFMWSDRVRVVSRSYKDAEVGTHVMEFSAGLDSRPVFRKARPDEFLQDGGTAVRVWLENDPEALGGVLRSEHVEGWAGGGGLRRICLWLCPALDTNLFIQRGGGSKQGVVRASDWQTLSDEDLIRRVLLLGARDPEPDAEETEFEANLRERTAELIAQVTSMLRPIFDSNGILLGRLALIPSEWRFDWPRHGVVTVGGFRSADLRGAAGILVGASARASRDLALPVASVNQLHAWALEQEPLVAARTKDPEALLEVAGTIRACGMIPRLLPIAQGRDGLITAASLRNWTPIPEEFFLINDDALSLLQRRLGSIELLPNVIAAAEGFRPFIGTNHRTPSGEDWPEGILPFDQLTLESAVEELIADLWQIPLRAGRKRLRERSEIVTIGMAGGKPVRERAIVLRRNPKRKAEQPEQKGDVAESGRGCA